MKIKKLIFASVIFIAGCQTYYINKYYLKGEWTDSWPVPDAMILGGSSVRIEFQNDSFFYYNDRWADYYNTKDTCPSYSGDEFACGRYLINEDYITLKGNWTDKSYKTIKTTGCYNNGEFEVKFRHNILDNESFELVLEDSTYFSKYPTGLKRYTKLKKSD